MSARRLSFVAACILAIGGCVQAQQAPAPAPIPPADPERSAPADTPATTPTDPLTGIIRRDDARKDVPWKPFSEVTRHAEVQTGLFTLYRKRDAAYLGLAPDQLGRDFLLVTQVAQGIGELGLDGGTSIRSDLVRFQRAGDRIELWVVNPHVAAAPGSPMARTVAYSFGHSVAHSFPIATIRDTVEILIDLTPFLLSDWADLAPVFQSAAARRKVGGTVMFDRDRSSVQGLRVFPTNLEAESRLTYHTTRNLGLETVPDYRWIPIGIHYSLLQLPAEPMRARYADDRVGYFVSAIKDFSRDTAPTFFRRYVNRWRLEKADPAAPLGPPVAPIRFYIDRTVPHEWRPYVRAGILEWNRAFEDAGFQNAIEVRDAPDDSLWSAEDARYSTVRWTATNRSVYAIGPTDVDPRTGEILNADILISAAWIQSWRGEADHQLTPRAAVRGLFLEDSLLRAGDPAAAGRFCRAEAGLARHGTVLRSLFAARGAIPPGGAVPREYIGQALKELVMHEVGHTLGLRHNFRGSAGVSAAQLADPTYTALHGTSVSVMDYNPPAIARDSARQGDFFSPTIGSYDRWAIRYGYGTVTPAEPAGVTAKGADDVEVWSPDIEVNGLRAIAGEASAPQHLFGTDEDAGFGGYGLDPTVSRYDLTNDPLGWARERVALINGLFDSLETRLVPAGRSYVRLRSAFTDLLTDRWYATVVTTKYLAGAITSRDHRGDPNSRPAFAPVSAARQREALAFLAEVAFADSAYRFTPELLNRLAPGRWMHWGADPMAQKRIDFPLHEWALAQQGTILSLLLDPSVLARLRDAELRTPAGSETITIPDVFTILRDAIWQEIGAPEEARRTARGRRRAPEVKNVPSIRRDLQRLHLNAMITLVVNPRPGTPEDARTVARATLAELGERIDAALSQPGTELDAYTLAHLGDSRERIAQALTAGMVQQVTPK